MFNKYQEINSKDMVKERMNEVKEEINVLSLRALISEYYSKNKLKRSCAQDYYKIIEEWKQKQKQQQH
jgi:predicted solute-binding protein